MSLETGRAAAIPASRRASRGRRRRLPDAPARSRPGRFGRGSDPRGRDPGWGGRDSGSRGASGNGWDPGPPAGRAAIPEPMRKPAECRRRGDQRGGSRSPGVRGVVPLGQPRGPGRGGRDAANRDTGGRDSAPRPARRHGAGPGRTARSPRAEESAPATRPGRTGAVGCRAGRPRGLHHRRQRGRRRHRYHGGAERARSSARTAHRGRHGGRLAGRAAQGRSDDLPGPGALPIWSPPC